MRLGSKEAFHCRWEIIAKNEKTFRNQNALHGTGPVNAHVQVQSVVDMTAQESVGWLVQHHWWLFAGNRVGIFGWQMEKCLPLYMCIFYQHCSDTKLVESLQSSCLSAESQKKEGLVMELSPF